MKTVVIHAWNKYYAMRKKESHAEQYVFEQIHLYH